MIGYIYQIINKVNNKRYIGQTTNIEERKYRHFNSLRKNQHHSQKLQRAFNKYGEENFNFIWDTYEIQNQQELLRLEQQTIEKFDSYNNGYNCTWGGEGTKLIFSYHEACILYKILQKYSGINRLIAKFYGCDHTVIDELKNNMAYSKEYISEDEILEYIKKLDLKDENLIENYTPHNDKKLSKEQCFEILSIILDETGYDRLIGDIYKVNTKCLWRLKHNLIYQDYIYLFNNLSFEEKETLKKETKKKYNLEHKRLSRKRGNVKNPLTQEQVNYILDNQGIKTNTDISKDLGISKDRVSAIIHHKSYKDLIENYYATTAVNKSQN